MRVAELFFISLILVCLSLSTLHAENEDVAIHGFISQGYLKTTRNNYIADSTDGTFQFNEMGLNFTTQPMDKLRIAAQFFARDFGSVGNDQIQIDYALADYRFTDYFGVRAGKLKNPMGLYSEYRDIDMLRTCIILPHSVYDETLRDSQTFLKGIGIYGDINTTHLGSVSYQALAGTNNIAADSATAIFLGSGVLKITSVDVDTTYSLALQYADPTGHVKLGSTAFFTDLYFSGETIGNPLLPLKGMAIDGSVSNCEIYTGSVELTWNPFVLTWEMKRSKVRNAVYTSHDTGLVLVETPVDHFGEYVSLTYQMTSFLQAGVYFNEFYPYERDRNGDFTSPGIAKNYHWVKNWAFSLKWDINPSWLLKLETQYADGTASVPMVYNEFTYDDAGNVIDGAPRYWWLHAVKVSYNF